MGKFSVHNMFSPRSILTAAASMGLDPSGVALSTTAAGNAAGLNGTLDYLTHPGNAGQMFKDDWNAIKSWLIPDMRKDREVMSNSATAARRVIYGRSKVGGNLVYAETSGATDQNLNVVVAFAGHAVTGYDEIWFDDKRAATVSGGIVTVLAPFAGFTTIELHDGTQAGASPLMVAQSHGGWTTDHKLLGCAYAVIQFVYNESVFAAGVPTVNAVIRGRKVYDPRTGERAWSDNPILCIRDYMTMPNDRGGMGCEVPIGQGEWQP